MSFKIHTSFFYRGVLFKEHRGHHSAFIQGRGVLIPFSLLQMKVEIIPNKTYPCLIQYNQRFCLHSLTWSGITGAQAWIWLMDLLRLQINVEIHRLSKAILWIVGKLRLFFLTKKHGWLSSCVKPTQLSSLQQKMFAFWRNSTVTIRNKNTEKTNKHGKRCKERNIQKKRKTLNQVKTASHLVYTQGPFNLKTVCAVWLRFLSWTTCFPETVWTVFEVYFLLFGRSVRGVTQLTATKF